MRYDVAKCIIASIDICTHLRTSVAGEISLPIGYKDTNIIHEISIEIQNQCTVTVTGYAILIIFVAIIFNTQANRMDAEEIKLEKSEYAVTPFKLNEMPKINEISHFAHIDYQAFAINDCAACF